MLSYIIKFQIWNLIIAYSNNEIFILISSREIRNILVWDETREILFLYKFSSSLKFCGILLITLICFSIM